MKLENAFYVVEIVTGQERNLIQKRKQHITSEKMSDLSLFWSASCSSVLLPPLRQSPAPFLPPSTSSDTQYGLKPFKHSRVKSVAHDFKYFRCDFTFFKMLASKAS